MACACGQGLSGLKRRLAPFGFPPLTLAPGGYYLEDRAWPGGKAVCSPELAGFASSPAMQFLEDVAGMPVASFLRGYCETGSVDAAGQRTARSLKKNMEILSILLPIAAGVTLLIPGAQPISAVLGVLTPVAISLIPVFDAMGKGQTPSGQAIVKAAGSAAGAAGKLGATTPDGLTEGAAAVSAAYDQARALGQVPKLDLVPQNAEPKAGRVIGRADALKEQLRRAKAKKRALEAAKLKIKYKRQLAAAKASAKGKSQDKSAACRARGGRFDPTAPDGCRVSGSSTSSESSASSEGEGVAGGILSKLAAVPLPVKIFVGGIILKKLGVG